ncbi:unnamed protein product [Diamesa tonsa]
MPNIEIGTAEYYQGREKKIIIISTVKSKDGIGFLKSEKRMNVVLTRAKCLLIIVGNPETLQKDQNWNSFIHFCKDNKACVGERFRVKKMTDQEETLVLMLTKTLNVADNPADEEANEVVRKNREDELKALEERLKKVKLLAGYH